jgi:proteasome accessory factor B
MDRLERLVNLVAALIDTDRPLTRGDIHERIEGYSDDPNAFRRNFERDKELLRQLGLPLSTEPVEPGSDEVGYRIPRERYELPDPGLDDNELAALRLAASAVHLEGGEDAVTRALRKLGGGLGAEEGGEAGRLAAIPGGDSAATAYAAVGERRRLRFTYRGEERVVDPWSLSFRRGHWYLAGFDHLRDEDRLFRLDRVDGELATEGQAGAFVRPDGFAAAPPPAWRLGEDEEVVAELLADAGHARFVRDALAGEGTEEERGDGAVLFKVPVRNTAAFRSLALDFLDHVEILGPPGLRDEFVSWLEGIASSGSRSG